MKEFVNKTEKELKTTLAEKQLALREFRFGVPGAKNRNVKRGKVIRKDIARVLTVLNNKTSKL